MTDSLDGWIKRDRIETDQGLCNGCGLSVSV